jgi:hypothetical protein
MAYVAISGELKQSVKEQIKHLQRKDSGSIPDVPDNVVLDTIPEDLKDKVWGEHRHLEAMMPKDWKVYREELCLKIKYALDDNIARETTFDIKCNRDKPFACPPNTRPYSFSVEVDEHHPLVAEFLVYRKKVAEVDARWDKVKVDVMKFLENCKSLNEAIKLWPDIRIYIPKQYIERIEKKAERAVSNTSALDILKGIDTDGAVAAAIGARLASAAGGSNV